MYSSEYCEIFKNSFFKEKSPYVILSDSGYYDSGYPQIREIFFLLSLYLNLIVYDHVTII